MAPPPGTAGGQEPRHLEKPEYPLCAVLSAEDLAYLSIQNGGDVRAFAFLG